VATFSQDIITKYFEAIDHGDGEGAACCFTADAVMVIPGAPGTSITRTGFEISDSLLTRSLQPWVHELSGCYNNAGDALVVKGRLLDRETGERLSEFTAFVTSESETGKIASFRAFRRSAVDTAAVRIADPSLSPWVQLAKDELRGSSVLATYPAHHQVEAAPGLPPHPNAEGMNCVLRVESVDLCGLYWSGFDSSEQPLRAALLIPTDAGTLSGPMELYWSLTSERNG
jgi:ketosteroid isomerase-like protein